MRFLWMFILVAGVSMTLTKNFLQFALKRSLIDIPNERSSHLIPTASGGGIAIVVTFLAGLPVLVSMSLMDRYQVIGISGAGVIVALIGYLDDNYNISVCWRLFVHFSAAIWGLYWLDGFPLNHIFSFVLDLNWMGNLLAAVFLVWVLNLYNFMDGIDGIASIETITVCIGGAFLYWIVVPENQNWVCIVLLLATVVGFLMWNFPPAKIFMGDVGSGFLGLILGLFSIQAAHVKPELFWGWVILLGAFIVDATVTLLRRVFEGEKVYEAHRNHAYQYASRKLGSHKLVALAFGGINLTWLLPWSVYVSLGQIDGSIGTLCAYSPLVVAACYLKAGSRVSQEV